MLLIDLAKAFDKVWHDGLIFKLHELNVPAHITYVFDSYLSNRKFSVYGDLESPQNFAGAPQGLQIK
jgi:hypothetical protein